MVAVSSNHHVSKSELDAIRTHANESGFLNVYRKRKNKNGAWAWVARCKAGGVLLTVPGGATPDPREAAARVVAWYRSVFGDRWREALAQRKKNPWRVRHSAARGGWTLAVWEFGVRVDVVHLRASGRPWRARDVGGVRVPLGRVRVFPTRAEATAYAATWLRLRYGLFAPLVAWRG